MYLIKNTPIFCMISLIIIQGLGIAFVVTRVNELNSFLGSKNKVWDSEAKWQLNCYRLLLVGAIMCSVCSLLACVFLAAASCMWGHKVSDLFRRQYNKVKKHFAYLWHSFAFFLAVLHLLVLANVFLSLH